MSEEKSIPVGRLGRLARMARVGTRTGASILLSRSADGAAAQAAAVLGTLRGLAAKIGQTASYVDGLIPEPYREAYESALSTLRAQAPTSSPSAIRAVVEAELGGPIDRLFVEWQDTPIASASIGQVHRARLHDGREVAVKVQHPGIDRAIEADLNNADVVRGLFSTLGPKGLNTKKVFSEVAARFREELDYQQEARHQKFFATLHAGDAKIHIPTVVDSHTSRRVLTTELCSGALLDQAARATEAMRRSYAEVLWRFVFKGILVGGQFNADPHPGNYLFRPDGSVTFLDFGCVQPLTDKQVHQARCIHKAALERDEVAFARHCAALLETRGGNYERLVLYFSRQCFEPLFSGKFRISHGFVAGLFNIIRGVKRDLSMRDRSITTPPPQMALLNRLQFGFYSVLSRLDVEADYAEVERSFLGAYL